MSFLDPESELRNAEAAAQQRKTNWYYKQQHAKLSLKYEHLPIMTYLHKMDMRMANVTGTKKAKKEIKVQKASTDEYNGGWWIGKRFIPFTSHETLSNKMMKQLLFDAFEV